jgi:hypothetical protein
MGNLEINLKHHAYKSSNPKEERKYNNGELPFINNRAPIYLISS